MNNLDSTDSNIIWVALSAIFILAFGSVAVFICILYLQAKYTGKQLSVAWKRYFKISLLFLASLYFLGGYICITWMTAGFPKIGMPPNPDLLDHFFFWTPVLLGFVFASTTTWFAVNAAYSYFVFVAMHNQKRWL